MPGELVAEEVHATQNLYNSYIRLNEKKVQIVARRQDARWSTWKNFFVSVFLPDGFPQSVSEDYVEYQIWDSLQAFSSSITNTLATHAVLKGIGVGDATATPVAATITWLLRDGTGMVGRIAFAYYRGSVLDADCKKWRLFADILNDFAIALDILSPYFKQWIIGVQCLSGFCKSLVGIAGGATRAALTQHQARRNNLADVSAKDGSQETLVNLVALIISLTVVPWLLPYPNVVALIFTSLTVFHVFANYRAVKAVSIEVFNLSRYQIVVDEYLKNGNVLSVDCTNRQENVWPFVFSNQINVQAGCSLAEHKTDLSRLELNKDYWMERKYFLTAVKSKRGGLNSVKIAFIAGDHDAFIPLKAMFHALCLNYLAAGKKPCFHLLDNIVMEDTEEAVIQLGHLVDKEFPAFLKKAMLKNWDFSRVLFSIDEWRLVLS